MNYRIASIRTFSKAAARHWHTVRIPINCRNCLLLAESHLTRRLFGAMLRRIAALPVATG